jgi:hypothetical protein
LNLIGEALGIGVIGSGNTNGGMHNDVASGVGAKGDVAHAMFHPHTLTVAQGHGFVDVPRVFLSGERLARK